MVRSRPQPEQHSAVVGQNATGAEAREQVAGPRTLERQESGDALERNGQAEIED